MSCCRSSRCCCVGGCWLCVLCAAASSSRVLFVCGGRGRKVDYCGAKRGTGQNVAHLQIKKNIKGAEEISKYAKY